MNVLAVVAVFFASLITIANAIAGTSWQSNGLPVCVVSGAQESPYAASVGAGETVVVWADTRDLDYDIYIQKLDANGQPVWSLGGVKVCGASYDQQFPAVVSDGSGGAIVIWQDGRLGDDGLDLYAQRVTPTGTMAWQADGVPVCSHEAGLVDPPLAFSHVVTEDGSGGVVVAWRDTRNDPINGNTEIYAQRLNGAGAVQWTTNGVKVLGFVTQKWSTRNPVIAPDGSGGAVIAWQDARNYATTGNDLYVQHVSSAGMPTWASNGVVACNAIGDQGYPDIMALTGGAAAVVWDDKRAGNYDIYTQQFDATGGTQFEPNGRLVCGSANDQRTPRICSDSSGGSVIAWTDKRGSTVYTDVYAQRFDASGLPLWAAQGAPVCTAAGSQTRVRMVPSGSGYTIMTWMDTRDETLVGVYDLYGQMIDPAAAPKWAAVGVPVAAIPGNNQRMQQVAGDTAGSLYAVWEDDRNAGDWDIFVQKLSPWTEVAGIAEAKSLPLGTPVSVPARVVTGSFSGFLYIEEADRSSGIRVEYPTGYAPGSLVEVCGTVESGLEPFIRASEVRVLGTSAVPGALGITASKLGSTSIGQIPGTPNVGLLVRTWGRVVALPTPEQPYIVITDGQKDIHVHCSTDAQIGDIVAVTGVCSGETTPTGPIAVILTRDTSDVRRIGL